MEAVVNGGESELPPVIRLNHPHAYEIWLRWRVLDRKFLPYPGGFIDQPEDIMQDLILLDSLFDTLKDIKNGRP
jgi:hypothetical protein